MKTARWIRSTALIAVLMLGVYGSALAATIWMGSMKYVADADDASTSVIYNKHESGLLRFIRTSVGYPEFLKQEGAQAKAVVSFHLSETGRIEAVQAVTDDSRLAEFISERLEGRSAEDLFWAWGRDYNLVLNFRFVNQ